MLLHRVLVGTLCWGIVAAPLAQAWARALDEGSCGGGGFGDDADVRDVNPAMQSLLEAKIREAGYWPMVARGRLKVALVDVTTPENPYYAGLNVDDMTYAASLPKIAILLTAAHAVESGRIPWTPKLQRRLTNMVVASNNVDATWAADLVGLPSIERTMRDPRYCFYDDQYGGLWLGKGYRRGGPVNRDPLFHFSHGATARQVARWYTMLERGSLVSPAWSKRMLEMMGPPKLYHKFVGGLKRRPDRRFLARKSGTWRQFHADSALIEAEGRRYVAVALAESPRGEKLLRQLIVWLDDVVADGSYRENLHANVVAPETVKTPRLTLL